MKLKWYDWDDNGEIPSGVKGIRHRDLVEYLNEGGFSFLWEDACDWANSDPIEYENDIIAYTLGEPLEGDK